MSDLSTSPPDSSSPECALGPRTTGPTTQRKSRSKNSKMKTWTPTPASTGLTSTALSTLVIPSPPPGFALNTYHRHIPHSFNSSPDLHHTSPSWLPRAAQPKMHTPKPGPTMRQNSSTQWSHGVLSGGRLIDVLENLSATAHPTDWSLALWLQENYIVPFGRVQRLDGLIVRSTEDMDMLQLAYSRYVDIAGQAVLMQRLWVPGLEPTYQVPGDRSPMQIPPLPRPFQRTVWRASDMYCKNGLEMRRQGPYKTFAGHWKDENGWDRKIWRLPGDNATEEQDKSRRFRSVTV